MDKLSEFLDDLYKNWDNAYWWLDHQWLVTGLLFVLAGVYELAIHYTKLRLTQTMAPPPMPPT